MLNKVNFIQHHWRFVYSSLLLIVIWLGR